MCVVQLVSLVYIEIPFKAKLSWLPQKISLYSCGSGFVACSPPLRYLHCCLLLPSTSLGFALYRDSYKGILTRIYMEILFSIRPWAMSSS